MIARYNRLSLWWGIPGILMQVAGNFLRLSTRISPNFKPPPGIGILVTSIGTVLLLVGTVLLLIGLAYYAKAKARNPAWCLFAFLSLIGLIVLACLRDRAHTEE
jgi:hypothetical protein